MPKVVDLDALIENRELNFISIDNSTMFRADYQFGSGVLASLPYVSKVFSLVMTKTVLREAQAHIRLKRSKLKSSFDSCVQKLSIFGLSLGDEVSTIRQELERVDAEDIEAFLIDSLGNPVVLNDYDKCTVEELFNAYFSHRPPFSEKKKNEFPDALSLYALESYARENNYNGLLVSNDNDWIEYCNQSEILYCIEDVKKFYAAFYDRDDSVSKLVEEYLSNKLNIFEDQLLDCISDGSLNLYPDYVSPFPSECEIEDYRVLNILAFVEGTLLYLSGSDVRYEGVFEVEIEADYAVSFYVKDEGDFISLGGDIGTVCNIVHVPITFFFKLEDGNITIDKIDVLPSILSFDMGQLDPF